MLPQFAANQSQQNVLFCVDTPRRGYETGGMIGVTLAKAGPVM